MQRSSIFSFLDKSVAAGRLFDIPIRLHITLIFFLLPAFRGFGFGFWAGIAYAAGIVLSILLHELGHALAATRYRLTGLSIMIHGFGGFAASEGHRSPKQQLVISLGGPAVTFAIGLLCYGIGSFGLQAAEFGSSVYVLLAILWSLGSLNLLLGVLNLFPSLPFDGGRALAAILSFRLSEFKALRAVGHLGLVLSPVLILYGLISGGPFLTIFGIIGVMNSLSLLNDTGGVKLGEFFADRKSRKELEAVKLRERQKFETFLGDVRSREKEREEKERLRRLLEAPVEERD